MALFTGAALFGTGLGPLCSGFIAQHTSYRWIFYVQIISCGLLMVLSTWEAHADVIEIMFTDGSCFSRDIFQRDEGLSAAVTQGSRTQSLV